MVMFFLHGCAHFAEAQKLAEVFGFSRGGIVRHGPHWFGILSRLTCDGTESDISWRNGSFAISSRTFFWWTSHPHIRRIGHLGTIRIFSSSAYLSLQNIHRIWAVYTQCTSWIFQDSTPHMLVLHLLFFCDNIAWICHLYNQCNRALYRSHILVSLSTRFLMSRSHGIVQY